MFDYENVLNTLAAFDKMKTKKQIKFLKGIFLDDSFMEWLFIPKKEANTNEKTASLYSMFIKPKIMRAIVEMFENTGFSKFNRTHATFIYSICNVAIATNNERIVEVERQRKEGEITNKMAQNINEKIERYNSYIADLIRCAKKIIRKEAKDLSRASNLPKYLCVTALHSVPEPKYVDRFKIGYYLNNLLNNVYSEVDALGGFNKEVRWRVFFKEMFGKENVVEAATFILLEGVHRIDKYKNSADVKECWDSLSAFALKELNEAPETIRNQMIELYIKRIDKMFANKAFDLRVNLLSLDESPFSKLADTVKKYSDRIMEILERGK